ncbi:MAG TPA: Crp/Fnr family transcriptional regulator, partial [Myxococcaceae bacterium]|nr:Crp/Fnr family transcriptional regulator [Myxococcaceae bacterium]
MWSSPGQSPKFIPGQFCRQLSAHLTSHCISRRLSLNETLYACGEENRNIYLIESGYLKMLMLYQDARECLLDICTSGEIIGESCLLGDERMEMVTAMTPCELRSIPRAEFIDIVFKNKLVEECLRHLAARLSEQRQIIAQFVTADSERRLAATLLRLARKLGRQHGGGLLMINERITQVDLAQIIGTTRSRVGCFLKRFREARLIETSSPSVLLVNE